MRVDRRGGGLKDSPRTLTRLNFQLPAKEEVFSFLFFSLSLFLSPRKEQRVDTSLQGRVKKLD